MFALPPETAASGYSPLPPALQLPGELHEITSSDVPPVPKLEVMVTSLASDHVPPVSLTANPTLPPPETMSSPTALQLPVAVHDIDSTPKAFADPMADGSMTSTAVPHVPPVSLMTNPCVSPEPSV